VPPLSSALPRSRRPVLLQAMAMAMDPEGFFARCAARRGDPFVVQMPSVGEVLMTGHPEGAREIFSAPPDTFEPLRVNPVEPLLGRQSLLLLSGERHRRERRLMSPPFHGERMRAYGAIIRDRTLAEARTWPVGGEVSLVPAMRRITIDVILRAVLGIEGEARGARFRAAIVENLDAYVPPLLVIPALRRPLGGLGPWDRFIRSQGRVSALFLEEIAERRRRGSDGQEDMLSLLMSARYEDGTALGDDELVDELRTLIVAGHDTTTTSLAWALFHVHRSPTALAALRDELALLKAPPPLDALGQLPYLGAVCSEALRLHPVVPIVPRCAVRPFSLRGIEVQAGQNVSVATTLLHVRPDVWPEPAQFLPERFLSRKYTPFEYAPFGGGARRCIGAAFGAYQMRIVLGTLVASVRFAAHQQRPPPRVLSSITMGPRGPVKLRVLASR
jgi:cytochrome P450